MDLKWKDRGGASLWEMLHLLTVWYEVQRKLPTVPGLNFQVGNFQDGVDGTTRDRRSDVHQLVEAPLPDADDVT